MGKLKINKNDKSRILLTELLPYEVPILFSNEGFYKYNQSKDKTNPPPFLNKILETTERDYKIPYSFEIKKGNEGKRILSLIHPAIQLRFIEFYKKYDSLIIHLCNRSPISLRFPSKVATHFYYKKDKNNNKNNEENGVEVEQTVLETDLIYSSSYFAYKKYNFIYKFYDSYEFLRLEKKFKNLLRFDISKCFDSIYTHTISWAVKDKTFAKENTDNKSFEIEFDKLMQRSNYNETNGILIGSEVSRIFAEIILQKIDLEAIEILKLKDLHFGSDYAVRRYVDDYFVFTKDEKIGKEIFKVFQEELGKYKLHINDSKTERTKTPFISGITIARTEIQKLLEDYFAKYVIFNTLNTAETLDDSIMVSISINSFRSSSNIANWIIRDIKGIVKKYDINYDSITGVSFGIFRKYLNNIYKSYDINSISKNQEENLSNLILVAFDIMFFLYSMDYRVRPTYVMSQIIISTNRFVSKCNDGIKHIVLKKIYDESIYLIKNIEKDTLNSNVELLNLLISLKCLGVDYILSADVLDALLHINKELDKFSYFHFIVLLYYIEDIDEYETLRLKIENVIVSKISLEENPFQKAEFTCLLLDAIRCPYISRKTKEELGNISLKKIDNKNPTLQERNRVIKYIAARNWFVDWSKEMEMGSILLKKELRTPY